MVLEEQQRDEQHVLDIASMVRTTIISIAAMCTSVRVNVFYADDQSSYMAGSCEFVSCSVVS